MKTNCCHSKQILKLEGSHHCLNVNCNNYLASCSPVQQVSYWKNLTALSVFWIYLFFSVDYFSMSDPKHNLVYRNATVIQRVPLNTANLKKELLLNQVICPDEVVAQIMLESGHLSSPLLLRTNNMLGMRFPFSRKTTAIGIFLPAKDTIIYGRQDDLLIYRKMNHYAVYKDWQDAVKDYKWWQTANFSLAEKYLNFLGNIYAQDTQYIAKIRQMALSRNQTRASR